jgi:hypothetical protein
MIGHLSPPPTAIGVTPAAFSVLTAASRSSQVLICSATTPAFLNSTLL